MAPHAPDAPSVEVDPRALDVLRALWRGGHAAYIVGGSVRDALLGRPVADWDIATDALPERVLELLPAGRYENRFGTVLAEVHPEVQVTTFRRDHLYRDHRRPDTVTFTTSLEEDLARRDFTVNAIAYGLPASAGEGDDRLRAGMSGDDDSPRARGYGADAGEDRAHGAHVDRPGASTSTDAAAPVDRQDAGAAVDRSDTGPLDWVDPTGGLVDLRAGVLRAVGDPVARFDEDALRLLRGVRLAARLGFTLEPATRAAMAGAAPTAAWLSHERVGRELIRMLQADPPSTAFRLMAEIGLLEPTIPELAAQLGVPQNKVNGVDLWGHTLATLDAAATLPGGDHVARLTALFRDIGKPETRTDEGFHGHEIAGALTAERVLTRMALAREDIVMVTDLVRQHMFTYEPGWSAAAVRRFIRRVGVDRLPRLIELRRADNIGSGLPADTGLLPELEARIAAELDRNVPLSLADLAVNGTDLERDAGIAPGPLMGLILERLLESVINDPNRNVAPRLLADARIWSRELAPPSSAGTTPSR